MSCDPDEATQLHEAASKRGRRSRTKGKRFEREVATALRALYGDGVKRGWQTRSGKDAPDVDGTPFFVECKSGKRVNIRAAMAQVLEATDGRTPIVVSKEDRGETLVTMRFDDWLTLAEAEIRARELTLLQVAKESQR